MFGEEAEKLREAGGEYGAKTGRPRRVGPIDLVATRYGVKVQAATQIALTKLDVLSYMDRIPVCARYRINGKETDRFPFPTELENETGKFLQENGHEFGDKVLKDVSDVFREQFGHHVYRYGGDEIVALSKSNDPKELAEKASAINKALHDLYPDSDISVSFGIAALEGDQDGNAIRKADKALYLAKHSDDHIHFFEE